jgi:hypothetical protein
MQKGKEQKQNKTDITCNKKEILLETLLKSYGNVSDACRMANISRNQFYNYTRTDEVFKEKVEELQESLIDKAETALYKQIESQNITAIIFFLKTKGKSRGYVERVEHVNKEVQEFDKTEEDLIKELEQLDSRIIK